MQTMRVPGRVLVVAGTHGNERNAPWLLEGWRAAPGSLEDSGLALELVIGNPEAITQGRRYCDRDLNRSFLREFLDDPDLKDLEVERARELLMLHGPHGRQPCSVVIDLHSTTAAMGSSLVLYGRRAEDLALASGLQARLGLPIYLHEGDPSQSGFLVQEWPCGLVVEVGPVPQGVVDAQICRQSKLALETALAVLAEARSGRLRLPGHVVVHRHLGSLDLPRHADGSPAAVIHPRRQHRDWQPIRVGDPLFLRQDGTTITYTTQHQGHQGPLWPVFINEAAYGEKGIALSLTIRERWPVTQAWTDALEMLCQPMEAA